MRALLGVVTATLLALAAAVPLEWPAVKVDPACLSAPLAPGCMP